ncbi:hypothetical protein [Brevibacillus laterosporus]|uniref:hypothetical protein n=1 Tax=Brevibacillus laterosporus TaxID=1465 RepID=UPI003D1CDDD2
MQNLNLQELVKTLVHSVGESNMGFVDGFAFLNKMQDLVNQMNEQNAKLKAENDELKTLLSNQSEMDEKVTPSYPDDFYHCGSVPYTFRVSEETVQEYVDELTQMELSEGQFVMTSAGDTFVLRYMLDGIAKTIVASNYYEYVEDVPLGLQ